MKVHVSYYIKIGTATRFLTRLARRFQPCDSNSFCRVFVLICSGVEKKNPPVTRDSVILPVFRDKIKMVNYDGTAV
jgi:hypothetical protein